MESVSPAQLRRGIRELGLAGRPVCVHSSLRSFGEVAGGAEAVVDTFLLERCTLLVPSFSWSFAVGPPGGAGPARNGFDYTRPFDGALSPSAYTPESIVVDRSMGAVPRAVVERQERVRGAHPLCSFAAVGPLARSLVEAQRLLAVFAPLDALRASGGYVLLAGVRLTTMTLLHLAEVEAGRRPFRRWALTPSGQVVEADSGGCSAGFEAFAHVLSPFVREAGVGGSRWLAYPAAEAVEAAAAAIRATPAITRCADPGCALCADAVAGGPLLER